MLSRQAKSSNEAAGGEMIMSRVSPGLATSHGRKTPAGAQLKISQEDLAQFLGLSRQIVNKHLQTWKRQSWISLGRGSVVLNNERALRDLTQQD